MRAETVTPMGIKAEGFEPRPPERTTTKVMKKVPMNSQRSDWR
jgi:hypothetical protein